MKADWLESCVDEESAHAFEKASNLAAILREVLGATPDRGLKPGELAAAASDLIAAAVLKPSAPSDAN